jgi:hypothetical protein
LRLSRSLFSCLLQFEQPHFCAFATLKRTAIPVLEKRGIVMQSVGHTRAAQLSPASGRLTLSDGLPNNQEIF